MQTISVLYQDESFAVDYSKLHNSSNKFREMIKPYLDNGIDPQNLQLRIHYDKFSRRNVGNFLKIVQNQKNDVHSNEMTEICELSKLFQAENLYNKSLSFIQTRVDPNFTVFNNFDESNGTKYLELEYVTRLNTQHSYSTNDITTTAGNLAAPKDKLYCVCYKIQVFNPLMKCCRFFFSLEGRILFTAKKKSNEIYIGQGNDIHIHGNETSSCARIMQCDGYNVVYTNEQEFKIDYVPLGNKQYSLETSFSHEGKTLFWSPREIDSILNGQYNHVPIPSKRNMLLKNRNGSPTFIVRKMDNDVFEVECLSSVNQLIAFAIGLSQIVGPYN